MIPPGTYSAKLVNVSISDDGVISQELQLEDGSTFTVTSKANEVALDEVATRSLKLGVARAIIDAAKNLDVAATTMRTFEQHFDEDDFDELFRTVRVLQQIADRIES